MLLNIDPILSPDLLHMLASMGHGHELVIADANFPGTESGPRCIRADGVSATDVLQAVLSVTPLDTFVPDPAICMEVVGDKSAVPDAVQQFQSIINETDQSAPQIVMLERFAFYERASKAFGVVVTGETRLYGNIIVKKGVISQ